MVPSNANECLRVRPEGVVSVPPRFPTFPDIRRSPRGTAQALCPRRGRAGQSRLPGRQVNVGGRSAVLGDGVLQPFRQLIPGVLPILPEALVLDVLRVVGLGEIARGGPDLVERRQDKRGQIVEILAATHGRNHQDRHIQGGCQGEEVLVPLFKPVEGRPKSRVESGVVPCSVRRVVKLQGEGRPECHVPRL